MLINEELERQKMTKYRLSKESGVPQATINDICSGKADIEKCSAGTLFRIARVLNVSIEAILESAKEEYRSSFDVFKSNTQHQVKDFGDLVFIKYMLERDEIRKLFNRQWYPEALYLLGMVDYLSRVNGIPECTVYEDIRAKKLEKPIYPTDILLLSKLFESDEPLIKAENEAIPEFKRFNIIENEVRKVA